MGLDSVELLMDIEDYFKISVTRADAERLYTIQDMVDIVAKHRNVVSEEKPLQTVVFDQMKTYFNKNDIDLKDKISPILSIEKTNFQQLSHQLKNESTLPTLCKYAA